MDIVNSKAMIEPASEYMRNDFDGIIHYNETTYQLNTYVSIVNFIQKIEGTTNLYQKKKMIDAYAELYMNNLLFKLPLTVMKENVAIWKGYGGENMEDFDYQEGMLGSVALGASWANLAHNRLQKYSANQLNLAIDPFPKDSLYNPLYFHPSRSELTDLIASPLVKIDPGFRIHPSIAYQWYLDNYNKSGTIHKNQRHIFVLNSNNSWHFNAAVDYNGTLHPVHPVDAQDYKLTLDIYNQSLQEDTNSSYPPVPFWFNLIDQWSVDTTNRINDTLIIDMKINSVNNIDYLSQLYPTPYHLISLDPEYNQSQGIVTTSAFDKLNSREGMATVGPYSISYTNWETKEIEYHARDDFPYPNERDTIVEMNNSTSGKPYISEIFAPHIHDHNNIRYWNYSENITKSSIETVNLKIIPDIRRKKIVFENGDIDSLQAHILGAYSVHLYQESPNFEIFPRSVNNLGSSTIELLYNLNNPYLRTRDVRYAIASAIN